ncbi:MAG: hypothetical protein ACTSQG_00425 [Promethearchaeota archaeon]
METEEIYEGEIVRDIIRNDDVFLIVDHNSKQIFTYNGNKCSLKLQIYGGILASMLRKQLKLFYRIFHLNSYSSDSEIFQEIMEKPLAPGRAKPIKKEDFQEKHSETSVGPELSIHPHLVINKALNYINELPKPKEYIRKLMIIGNNIYIDEAITEKFVQEEKIVIKPVKMGNLNRGFSFFEDNDYSIRMIVKNRKVQGIELFVRKGAEIPCLELKTPIIKEERLGNVGKINDLIEAFQIPKEIPLNKDDEKEVSLEEKK